MGCTIKYNFTQFILFYTLSQYRFRYTVVTIINCMQVGTNSNSNLIKYSDLLQADERRLLILSNTLKDIPEIFSIGFRQNNQSMEIQ